MAPDATAIIDLVQRNVPNVGAHAARVYFDSRIKNVGERVRLGLREVPMPFRGFSIFVDLMPDANWGHKVAYLLADENLSHAVRYDEQFPPFGSNVPANWLKLR